ncbi:uncharacterized protein LOC125244366, partial [Megalobrama amblycephala]|uniref:uncharacterized protein LOC125244366 n=1 Tax=Megalobrama amblycephala TaxID=75352 RepID=UPI0020146479
MDELRINAKVCYEYREAGIVALTETWLNQDIPDPLFELDGFSLVRSDRTESAGKCRGGGIAVYIRNDWCTQYTVRERRFSPLSDAPTENPVESALVIADSITRNVKIETPATIVTCLPGARAPDIKANLKVLANANRKYSKIIIHVGTNDVRLRQSEITKINIKEVCELASTISGEVICSGPLPVRRSDEIVSRLSSLNGWLSKWCPQNNIGFIDNWKSFWGRPDLLKRDGIHPFRDGAALLSSNMAHS